MKLVPIENELFDAGNGVQVAVEYTHPTVCVP